MTLDVSLIEYLQPPRTVDHLIVSFVVNIETGINLPPYFDPPLSDSTPLSFRKTHESEEWVFALPSVKDYENNDVDIRVDLGAVVDFITYDETNKELSISDLSDHDVKAGIYTIEITLDDGEPANLVVELISLSIFEAEPLPEPEPEPEEPEEEQVVKVGETEANSEVTQTE